MKRLLDILLVLVALPVWLPLSAVAAVLVALTMGRPILFSQERAGRAGKPFRLFKFRTMRPGDAPDSERLTPVGRFLRATSLDELPQLVHVLGGAMSLVGPRPLPVRYLPRYSAAQRRRHDIRPGLTGWAQINGRNALSWDARFALDLWYVENRSLALDLKILLLTVLRVLRRDGINVSAVETMSEFTGPAAEAT
jgi:lipopolysaccharide/colanic/teichoic acid biosynthesis glycosyltransferase